MHLKDIPLCPFSCALNKHVWILNCRIAKYFSLVVPSFQYLFIRLLFVPCFDQILAYYGLLNVERIKRITMSAASLPLIWL